MSLLSRLLLALALLGLIGCGGIGGGAPGSGLGMRTSDKNRDAARIQVQLAQEYLKSGRLDVARDRLKRALEFDPYSAEAHTVSGFLHETINDGTRAELHYRRALELQPRDGGMANNYANFLCRQGRYAESEPVFRRAISDPFYKTPEVAMANAGICAKSAGNLDQAEAYLREALARRADYGPALLPMAWVLFERGEHLRARAFMQRYEAHQTPSAEGLLLGVRIEQALGDAASAEDYRRRLLNAYPRSAEALSLEN